MVLHFREIVICLCVSYFIFFTTTVALTSSIQFPKTFENLEMVQVLRESYLEFFKTDLNITDEKLAKEMVVKLLPDTYRPFIAYLRFDNEKSFDHFKQSLRQNIKNTFSQPKYKDLTDLLRNNTSEFKRIDNSFEVMKDDIHDLHELQKEYNEISSLNKQVTETLPDFIKAIENTLSELKRFSTDYRTSHLHANFKKTALKVIDMLKNPESEMPKLHSKEYNFSLVFKYLPDPQIYDDYVSAMNALFDKILKIDIWFYQDHLLPLINTSNSFSSTNVLLLNRILDNISKLNRKSDETYTIDTFFVFLKDVIEKCDDLLNKKYNESKYFYNGNHIYKFLNGYTPEEYLRTSFLDATKKVAKSTQIKHFPNLKKGSYEKASNDNLSKRKNDGSYIKKETKQRHKKKKFHSVVVDVRVTEWTLCLRT